MQIYKSFLLRYQILSGVVSFHKKWQSGYYLLDLFQQIFNLKGTNADVNTALYCLGFFSSKVTIHTGTKEQCKKFSTTGLDGMITVWDVDAK